jgi:anaphase-promoting complex subunit 6
LLVLRGRILEAMDNRAHAADSFKEALNVDPFCQEALQSLTKHQMLSSEQESQLLISIPLAAKCQNEEEKELISFLYSMGMKKYDKPKDLIVPKALQNSLKNNTALDVALAERHYYNCDYSACCQISTKVMKKDPFHDGCLPIHISCLVELKKSNGKCQGCFLGSNYYYIKYSFHL